MSTLFTIYPISCSVYILAQWVNVLHSLVGFSESTIVVNNLSGSNFQVIHRVADPHTWAQLIYTEKYFGLCQFYL